MSPGDERRRDPPDIVGDQSGPSPPWIVLSRRLIRVVAVAAAFLTVSTIGYMVVAEYSWFDALYMSVITVGSVGFAEVKPLATPGRVWTILVVCVGNGLFVYATGYIASALLSGEFTTAIRRRNEHRKRSRMKDHVIVVGVGRVGLAVIESVLGRHRPVLGIDLDDTRVERLSAAQVPAMVGDAARDSVLIEAGIERAEAMVVTADDTAATAVILAARAIAPNLRIVVRANEESSRAQLLRAGADLVLAPYVSVGDELAAEALDADVVFRHPLPRLGMAVEELEVPAGSPVIGQMGADLRDRFQLIDLSVLRQVGGAPTPVTGAVEEADVVLAVAESSRLDRFAAALRRR